MTADSARGSVNISLDAYQTWCQRQESDCLLRDGAFAKPRELLLQFVWQHQCLCRDGIQTLDGRRCQILHPGFWNYGPGPDFKGAVIRLNGAGEIVGDIEIDCEIGGWKAHGHEGNPAFSNVILQVVWATESTARLPKRPIVALEDCIRGSLQDLASLFSGQSPQLPDEFRGKCCAPLFELPLDEVRSVLRIAATERFQQKGKLFEARARLVGWRLALWEGLVAGLGYSRNSWPMRCIAELTPELFPGFPEGAPLNFSAVDVEARLFGIAGFLPKDPNEINSPYLHELWEVWWRIRDQFRESIMPRGVWRIGGLRPHNHPHRRLALVSQWVQRPDFFNSLEWWFTSATEKNSIAMLVNALSVIAPPFWSSRFNFNRVSMRVSPHLLGEARMIDLAINSILPWFWVRAKTGGNELMMKRAECLFFTLPRSEENRALKNARTRLMGRCDPKMLGSAADQQGVLQILQDFCAHSNALCQDCRFPELLRSCGLKGMN